MDSSLLRRCHLIVIVFMLVISRIVVESVVHLSSFPAGPLARAEGWVSSIHGSLNKEPIHRIE